MIHHFKVVAGHAHVQGKNLNTGFSCNHSGCGGAAMAAAYALCSLGYSTTIINRNIQKAKDVAERISEALSVEVSAYGLEDFRKLFRRCGVIVYSLPVALDAIKTLDTKDIRGSWLGMCRNKVLLEANYKDPAFGPELIEKYTGINHKFTYIDGKEWLLLQAVTGYEIFIGQTPDYEAMKAVIKSK